MIKDQYSVGGLAGIKLFRKIKHWWFRKIVDLYWYHKKKLFQYDIYVTQIFTSIFFLFATDYLSIQNMRQTSRIVFCGLNRFFFLWIKCMIYEWKNMPIDRVFYCRNKFDFRQFTCPSSEFFFFNWIYSRSIDNVRAQ